MTAFTLPAMLSIGLFHKHTGTAIHGVQNKGKKCIPEAGDQACARVCAMIGNVALLLAREHFNTAHTFMCTDMKLW